MTYNQVQSFRINYLQISRLVIFLKPYNGYVVTQITEYTRQMLTASRGEPENARTCTINIIQSIFDHS